MRWPRQVVHVAWKDARMLRWFIAVAVGLVLLAAVPAGGGMAGYSFLLLALSGIGAVAVAVQADSPVRGDAFWVSRPLSPSAVLAAKLLVVLGALALAAVALVGVFVGHDVALVEYPGQLGFSGFVLGTVLATVLTIAVVTQDLRGFGFGWILAVVGWVATGILVSLAIKEPLGTMPWWLMPAIIVGGGLVIAAYQYVTGRLLVSILLIVVFALGTAATSSLFNERRDGSTALPPLSAALRPRAVEAVVFDSAGGGQLANGVAVRITGANPAYKYMLWNMTLSAPGARAPRTTISNLPYAALTQGPTGVLGLTGLRWAGQPPAGEVSAWVHIGSWPREIPPTQPLAIHARLAVSQGVLLGRVPLEVGRSFVNSGYRVRIEKLSNGPNGAQVVLRMSIAGGASDASESGRNANYMLLDVDRKLLFPLNGGARSLHGFAPLLMLQEQERHLWPRPAAGVRPPRVGEDRLELVMTDTHNVAVEQITIPVQRVMGPAPAMMEYEEQGRQIYLPLPE